MLKGNPMTPDVRRVWLMSVKPGCSLSRIGWTIASDEIRCCECPDACGYSGTPEHGTRLSVLGYLAVASKNVIPYFAIEESERSPLQELLPCYITLDPDEGDNEA